jgi:hypothetical protein
MLLGIIPCRSLLYSLRNLLLGDKCINVNQLKFPHTRLNHLIFCKVKMLSRFDDAYL